MRPLLSRIRQPAAAMLLVALSTAGPAFADPVPETLNGLPLLPIPTYNEVGIPPFSFPTGTPSTGRGTPAPPDRTVNEAGSGDVDEGVDHANRVVLVDVVVNALRQEKALRPVPAFNVARHETAQPLQIVT